MIGQDQDIPHALPNLTKQSKKKKKNQYKEEIKCDWISLIRTKLGLDRAHITTNGDGHHCVLAN